MTRPSPSSSHGCGRWWAVEQVQAADAAGRFLAKDIVSPRPIPAHDNAAVDGYAFAHAAYDQANGARLKVVGQAAAGHPFTGSPPP